MVRKKKAEYRKRRLPPSSDDADGTRKGVPWESGLPSSSADHFLSGLASRSRFQRAASRGTGRRALSAGESVQAAESVHRLRTNQARSRGRRSSRTDSAPVCGDYINAFSTVPGAFPRGAGGVVVQRCLGGLGHAQEPLHFLGPHALSAWRSQCNADAESMAPEAGAPAPPLLLPSAAHTPARTPRRRPLGAHVTATPVGTGRERRVTPGRRPCASAGCSRTSAAAHLFSNEPA
ncbi:hypothetical protein HPB51_017347 [Rhipicephalus microplus]|uniref:Uncharacterized protein n=1 Tax=Rhipicephalus microplus TaxID=6941 RepID=A0A9J6EHH9_RHIMP|nr:hypothetical protein HPB51_017347 [Rhipicephalus microplus]